MKNKNHVLFYIQQAGYGCASLVASGAFFQTFMLECGISEEKVSLCVSVMQVVQTVGMILLSQWADRVKNILGGLAVCFFSFGIPLTALFFLSIHQNLSIDTKYIILFSVCMVFSLFLSVFNILSYKQPHHIMDIRDYGRLTAQSGVMGGILSAACSALITLSLSRFPYFQTMAVVSAAAILFAGICGAINFIYTPVKNDSSHEVQKKVNLFRYKPFYQLLAPNFLRGVSTGILNLITVIGYCCNILDSTTAALLVTVAQVGTLVSCQGYVFIAKKQINGLLCLLSCILMAVTLPCMLIGQNKTVFIVFYIIAYLFYNIVNTTVPIIVAEYIDYNCLGQYTAWRMGLYAFGISIGGILVPLLLEYTGGVGTMICCGILMLPRGIGYYLFERRARKNRTENSG